MKYFAHGTHVILSSNSLCRYRGKSQERCSAGVLSDWVLEDKGEFPGGVWKKLGIQAREEFVLELRKTELHVARVETHSR